MAAAEDPRSAAALDWVRRIHDPTFDDWDGHLAWLEEDRDNVAAFDRMSLVLENATAGLSPVAAPPAPHDASNDNRVAQGGSSRRIGTGWYGGALGGLAAAVLLAVFGPWNHPAATNMMLQTRPGETRVAALDDGSRIALNGDTLVRIGSGPSRDAALERGQAFFTIAHDDARPFRVTAGDIVLQDVGTAFDVARHGPAVDVAVREGRIMVDPDGQKLLLGAGRGIRVTGHTTIATDLDPASVGGWRVGRLVYRDDAIARVVEDIGRSIGEPVSVSGAAATQRFTGVVVIDGDRRLMFRRLAAVTGLAVAHDATGWQLALPNQ